MTVQRMWLVLLLSTLAGLVVQFALLPRPSSELACPALVVSRSGLVGLVVGQCDSHHQLSALRALLAHSQVGEVYVACRTLTQTDKLVTELGHQNNNARVVKEHVDLLSLTSTRAFARRLAERVDRFDFAIVLSLYEQEFITAKTEENGLEQHVAINHLAPSLLSRVLLPRRMVHVVTRGDRPARQEVDIDNWVEDGQVPNVLLAQVLFSQALSNSRHDVLSNIVMLARGNSATDTAVFLALADAQVSGSIWGERCQGVGRPEYFDTSAQQLVWDASEFAVDPKGTAATAAHYLAPKWNSFQAAYEFQSNYLEHHQKQQQQQRQQHGEEAAKQPLKGDKEEYDEEESDECQNKLTKQLEESDLEQAKLRDRVDQLKHESEAHERALGELESKLQQEHASQVAALQLECERAKQALTGEAELTNNSCATMQDAFLGTERDMAKTLDDVKLQLTETKHQVLNEALKHVQCQKKLKDGRQDECLLALAQERAQHASAVQLTQQAFDAKLAQVQAETEALQQQHALQLQEAQRQGEEKLEELRQAMIPEINHLHQTGREKLEALKQALEEEMQQLRASHEQELQRVKSGCEGSARERELIEQTARTKLADVRAELDEL
ncbi:hypothetical protein BASA81_010249 [Batrachochytrium salamandrivorans]|nr:hypothetical protein BASA81_010249 [Batrachochytrium salamandrivorans]